MVRTRDNRTIKLILPEASVSEDRQPSLVDIDGDGTDEIVRFDLKQEEAQPLRSSVWFDGDGILDIAYVQMPHVLGPLRIWTTREGSLIEIGTLPDTSNHVAGSRDNGLSVVADFDGDGVADLALPPVSAVADFRLEILAGKPVVVVGLGGGRTYRASYR